MSSRALVVFVSILSLAVVAFPACGNEEAPDQRAFNASQSPTHPPKQVRTQLKLKNVDGTLVVDVQADEDYCEVGRTVTIYEDLAKDKKVGKAESKANGQAKLKPRVAGRYYASVPDEPSPEAGETCKKARSQTVVVKK